MDVHKESYNLCAVDGQTGEILGETRCAADPKMVCKFIKKVKKPFGTSVEIQTGYEAGVLGYSLHDQLEKQGVACEILAPTTMYSSAKNKRVKNDKMDAKMIASNLAHGTYKAVYVPEQDDVEVKEYIRMRNDFKTALKKVKQQIKALVLRQGKVYPGNANWTIAYLEWLKQLELPALLKETLEEYLLQYDNLVDKIERYDARIEGLSHTERYEAPIAALRCIKGIDTTAAMTIQVEISDFLRFPNPKAFTSFVGLTPSEDSSGDKVNRNAITKQGNQTVRSLLMECSQALVKGTIGKKSKRIKQRQQGQDSLTIAYADRGVERLQRKYHQMMHKGKPRNVVITAVARELACFIWGIETGNIDKY